jgi:hypothetical protein
MTVSLPVFLNSLGRAKVGLNKNYSVRPGVDLFNDVSILNSFERFDISGSELEVMCKEMFFT